MVLLGRWNIGLCEFVCKRKQNSYCKAHKNPFQARRSQKDGKNRYNEWYSWLGSVCHPPGRGKGDRKRV